MLRDADAGPAVEVQEGPEITVPAEEGRMLIFRHDTQSYTFELSEDTLALQAWVMAEAPSIVYDHYQGDVRKLDQAMGLMDGPAAPIYGKTGKSVSLMSMDCQLAETAWEPTITGPCSCRGPTRSGTCPSSGGILKCTTSPTRT